MNKEKKKKNPLVLLMAAFILLLLISAALLFITYRHPRALLRTPPEFTPLQVQKFEPWSFTFNDLDFDFLQGGVIIPAQIDGEQWGVFIAAPGTMQLGTTRNNISSMFFVLEPGQLEAMKAGTLFIPVKDQTLVRQYLELFSSQARYPSTSLFGFNTSILPGSGEYVLYPYFHRDPMPMLYSLPTLKYTAFYYLLAIGLLLTITYIITVDLNYDHRSSYCRFPWLKAESFLLPATLLATVALRLFSYDLWLIGGFLLLALMLLILRYREIIPPLDFGANTCCVIRSAITGMIVSLVFILFIAPFTIDEILLPAFKDSWWPTLLGLAAATGQEIIFRGYIQTAWERFLGKNFGLAVAAAALTILEYGLLLLITPTNFPLWRISRLTTLAGVHILAGFIYQQTENISGAVILHWCLLYLPPLFL